VTRNPDGTAITGIVVSELAVAAPTPTLNLSSGWFTGLSHASYPSVSLDKDPRLPLMDGFLPALATRTHQSAARVAVPAGAARFADCPATEAKPDNTRICFPDGFQPGRLYDLAYRARDPLVMGLGFAAARDLGAFLKAADKDGAGTANPVVHGKAVKAVVFGGDALCTSQGSFIPCAPTRAERQKAGDPRLSVEERYPTPYAYRLAVHSSGDILVRQRFMLQEDADRLTAEAERNGIRTAP
jgi:hypothetical protein